tara:strand:+ start:239 stop:481 length:243 start_codon:yes stop_codon:yes gene_type:complete
MQLLLGRTRLKERVTDPPKGEKVNHPIISGVNLMASITYRGVKYNAEEYKKAILAEQDQHRNHELMYRGIKVERKFVSQS